MIVNSQLDGGFILRFDGKRIPFSIEYRKRKKLAITVHPDLRLEVVAPIGSDSQKVLSRVEKRTRWILKQWRYFEQYQPRHPDMRGVSGETLWYLGRQYRLKIHAGKPESVKLIGRFLHVHTNDRTKTDRVRALIDDWYRHHAERVFRQRLQHSLAQCSSLKLADEPRLAIRKMTRRWGSCTKTGNVLLNLELIKVPVHCVDYVLVHELCHLQVHDHSPAFYRLLNRCMPDWERRKSRLEGFVM